MATQAGQKLGKRKSLLHSVLFLRETEKPHLSSAKMSCSCLSLAASTAVSMMSTPRHFSFCSESPSMPLNLSSWRVNMEQNKRSDAAFSQSSMMSATAALQRSAVFCWKTELASRICLASATFLRGASSTTGASTFLTGVAQLVNGQKSLSVLNANSSAMASIRNCDIDFNRSFDASVEATKAPTATAHNRTMTMSALQTALTGHATNALQGP